MIDRNAHTILELITLAVGGNLEDTASKTCFVVSVTMNPAAGPSMEGLTRR